MKSSWKKFTWVVILVVVGFLGLTVAVVAEDIDWPWSSEPGVVPSDVIGPGTLGVLPDEGGPALPQEAVLGEPSGDGAEMTGNSQLSAVEPQPDEDGYAGPVLEDAQTEKSPSGAEQTEALPNWDELIPETAPDRLGNVQADPNWTGFYYYHVPGAAFRPRDSTVSWASDGSGGCVNLSAGTTYVVFNLQLDIPHGARIDYLRIFYYDTNATSSTAWVTRYDDVGGLQDVTNVSSAGTAGYGTVLSAFVDHIVDSVDYSYVLNWRPNVLGSTMRLCGLRVAYRLP